MTSEVPSAVLLQEEDDEWQERKVRKLITKSKIPDLLARIRETDFLFLLEHDASPGVMEHLITLRVFQPSTHIRVFLRIDTIK